MAGGGLPLLVYLIHIAWTLKIDYYDSYEIIPNGVAPRTEFPRLVCPAFPWMPLLLSPLFAIERFSSARRFRFPRQPFVAGLQSYWTQDMPAELARPLIFC